MKRLILLCGILSLAACASHQKPVEPTPVIPPPQPVKEVPAVIPGVSIEKMERREVIQAIQECEEENMKGYVEYLTQRTEFGKVMVPVNVHCIPSKKK